MLNVQTALRQGVEILEKASVSVPRLTAEVLLCHALHCDRTYLYAHGDDELTELAWIHYGRYLNERLKGKPTQYITRKQEFYGRDYYVTPDVLIPRPETEHLVETAVEFLKTEECPRVLDVGTGSGAIAISVALESGSTVLASDVSMAALDIAERNRRTYDAPVSFFAGDLLEAVAPASVDLLLSNPPYVPSADSAHLQSEVRDWEPHVALFGGETGFDMYRRLLVEAEQALRPGGRLIMELGFRAADGVHQLLASTWTEIEVISDLAGFPRVISAKLAL